MVKFITILNAIIMVLNSIFGFGFSSFNCTLDADKLASNVAESTYARIEDGKLTGAQVIVNQNSVTLLSEVYGKSSAEGEDLVGNEIYRIASMTKPITAVALLIEQDRGNLSIYDDVSKYLPEFADMDVAVFDEGGNVIGTKKAENSIKVYQLVSHASGIVDVNVDAIGEKNCTIETATAYLANQPLNFDPGTSEAYSTGAFDVAARIVELTSGMDFAEYIKVNIFDKLGMVDTTFEPTPEQWDRMVAIHNRDENGKNIDVPTVRGYVFANFPVTYHAAGAALASTASDYMKFAEMLLNGGKAADGTVVMSEKAVELMSTPANGGVNTGVKWGLGVRVLASESNGLPVGTFGWSGAYGSHFWVDPSNKITAVYMKNSAYDGGAGNASANEFERDVMNSFKVDFVSNR